MTLFSMRTNTSSIPDHHVTLGQAFRVWLRVAIYSFGGPAGQIAVMHRILVEEKRWLSESRFLHALNYCMLLPGPEAQQLATYIGWLLHRTAGGLMAGLLFILPGFLSILALSVLYAGYQDTRLVQALFYGLKPAVVAVVAEAVVRIGRRALKNRIMVALAAGAFIAIFFFNVPFPFIVLAAGLIGFAGGRIRPDKFHVVLAPQAPAGAAEETGAVAVGDQSVATLRPPFARTARVAATWLLIWLVPLALLLGARGRGDIFVEEGLFFSRAAVVTFGGAYAVLAYIAQEAVETYGWLEPGEMLDGLGMAETTPGPLIQVVQFVAFMGAYRHAAGLDPLTAGLLGSMLVTWMTFAPCFLFIFTGAPYIEALRGNHDLSAALSGITAAVVGVILNLALWFSIHTLFGQVADVHVGPLRLLVPEWQTIDPAALLIAAGALFALFRLKAGMMPTLAGSATLGFIYFWWFT
jgi:chromate transporter